VDSLEFLLEKMKGTRDNKNFMDSMNTWSETGGENQLSATVFFGLFICTGFHCNGCLFLSRSPCDFMLSPNYHFSMSEGTIRNETRHSSRIFWHNH
jgi:hypothetical protein